MTLQSTCGSTGSICETFTNKTALFAENIGDVLINDELGRPKRIYDDNGDGLAGYNIYTVTFTGASNYENVSYYTLTSQKLTRHIAFSSSVRLFVTLPW